MTALGEQFPYIGKPLRRKEFAATTVREGYGIHAWATLKLGPMCPEAASSNNFSRVENVLRALVPLPGEPFRKEAGKFIPCFRISLHPDLEEGRTRRRTR